MRYLLDTNTASYIIKGSFSAIEKKLISVPMSNVCISSITEAELLFGLARKPDASQLKIVVHEFLLRVEILPWDSCAARSYAHLRSELQRRDLSLGAMDMLIAAHSLAGNMILVSNDQAFYKLKNILVLEDWSI